MLTGPALIRRISPALKDTGSLQVQWRRQWRDAPNDIMTVGTAYPGPWPEPLLRKSARPDLILQARRGLAASPSWRTGLREHPRVVMIGTPR
jgi:hypothetical protein